MREATPSLSVETNKGDTLAKAIWEVMLMSKDNYNDKCPSGGYRGQVENHGLDVRQERSSKWRD